MLAKAEKIDISFVTINEGEKFRVAPGGFQSRRRLRIMMLPNEGKGPIDALLGGLRDGILITIQHLEGSDLEEFLLPVKSVSWRDRSTTMRKEDFGTEVLVSIGFGNPRGGRI
jgi:hypothetical protein